MAEHVRVFYWRSHRTEDRDAPTSGRETRQHGFVPDERLDQAEVIVDRVEPEVLAAAVEDATGDRVLDVEEWHVHELGDEVEMVGRNRPYRVRRCECGFYVREEES